jgi:hypothetical protein
MLVFGHGLDIMFLSNLNKLKKKDFKSTIWGKYRNIFFSEAIALIEPKLYINHWKVLYKFYVFYADRKSKMAGTAGYRLTLDPMGKCSNGHLGFLIGIKNIYFVEDLPVIIPGQFGFNCPSGFREEAF